MSPIIKRKYTCTVDKLVNLRAELKIIEKLVELLEAHLTTPSATIAS